MNNKAIAMVLAVVMASISFCIIAEQIDAADNDGTDGLQGIIDSAEGQVTLTRDFNTTNTVILKEGITIDGGNHVIKYSGSGAAVEIKTTSKVILNELCIKAESSNALEWPYRVHSPTSSS